MAVFDEDKDISPAVVVSVPFFGGILAILMIGGTRTFYFFFARFGALPPMWVRAWGDGKTIELCFVVLVVRIRAREAYREDRGAKPGAERGVWRLRVCGRF